MYDVCALSADEVLLACGYAGLRAVSLRAVSLHTAQPTTIRDVYRAAFDTHTDTLLLVVKSPTDEYSQLVSLRRNASEWLEVQHLYTRLAYNTHPYTSILVCDSRVLLVEVGMDTLYVFDVSAEHTLHYAGNATL